MVTTRKHRLRSKPTEWPIGSRLDDDMVMVISDSWRWKIPHFGGKIWKWNDHLQMGDFVARLVIAGAYLILCVAKMSFTQW